MTNAPYMKLRDLVLYVAPCVVCGSFVYVVVGHRAVVFLQVLETSPCRGGAAEIFNLHDYANFFQVPPTATAWCPATLLPIPRATRPQ
jgi:hypothetical protein